MAISGPIFFLRAAPWDLSAAPAVPKAVPLVLVLPLPDGPGPRPTARADAPPSPLLVRSPLPDLVALRFAGVFLTAAGARGNLVLLLLFKLNMVGRGEACLEEPVLEDNDPVIVRNVPARKCLFRD